MWHYANDVKYSVKLVYRMIREVKARMVSSPSAATTTSFWKKLWTLDIPPKIKMCAWRAASRALLSKVGVARRVHGVSCLCDIYREWEETDYHALFECCLARGLWVNSDLEHVVGLCLRSSVLNTLMVVYANMGEKLEAFVTMIWACWQARNTMLFGQVSVTPKKMVERAFALVKEYREASAKLDTGHPNSVSAWKAPSVGYLKVNFDGALIGEECHGLGMVVRDGGDCIVMAGVRQGIGRFGPEYVEAMACRWAMQQALEKRFETVIMEGDFLGLISKLQKGERPITELGLIIHDILMFVDRFSFCSFCHVKRAGNRVAHTFAHVQPYNLSECVWMDECPDCILNLVANDLCNALPEFDQLSRHTRKLKQIVTNLPPKVEAIADEDLDEMEVRSCRVLSSMLTSGGNKEIGMRWKIRMVNEVSDYPTVLVEMIKHIVL
ncbi:hypothetical protein Cgig2_000231 [Carnegiea gigantea]|uniref:RNase H type-1 domain-containing protein n=1 Tax=Carnegiea gigantea TaxID=171969 RepID=A0A9Q1JSU9_9CARY|nr:hypothetical protein Cgig2_000231 [Carnegiea gigantea]